MSKTLWQKIEDIFPLVADLPEAERERRLRELCAGDEELRREIANLLAADEKAADFCESPAALPDSLSHALSSHKPEETATLELSGEKFGAYRIVRKIGAGGMGAVYLAVRADGAFHKEVAVKLVKNGADTEFNLRRFRYERQILARLEHPNIARLLDGGTTEAGAPYFVMEYVEGKPLFDYCTENNLDLRGRLQLFRQICAAVAYAHKAGVIHRDLKPGNILVTAHGAAKLLDFGIAKIFDADLIQDAVINTETLMRQLTPEYASPEQIKGENITPASDVYSLGIILYELLTGKRPYKFPSRAPHEIARVICEEKVQIPKLTAHSPFPDELSFIILKALRKEPSGRYASVGDFDRDVERFLADLPAEIVNARPLSVEKTATDSGGANVSLAVVPFQVLSAEGGETADSKGDFLSVGLADALTTRLSGVRQLAVRPTSSVMRLAAENRDAHALGEELKVDYVLGGHILRVGGQIRVSVQLLKTRDNSVLWAGQFDESDADIFRLQDSISERVAAALVPRLTAQEQEGLRRHGTESAAAFEMYLRGRALWHAYKIDGIAASIEHFKRAVAEDPSFALAHCGIADYYNWAGVAGFASPAECFPLAKEAARKAIELDGELGEAWASLGFATWAFDWNFAEAENLFRRALQLNPNYVKTREWYAYLLSSSARHDEAIAEMNRAERLDPNSPTVASLFGFILHNARRYKEGWIKNERALELEPDYYLALQGKCLFGLPLGKVEEGIESGRRAVKLVGEITFNKWTLATSLAIIGQSEEAREIAREIEERGRANYVPSFYLALIYAALNESDTAFRWLDKAIEERGYWTLWMRVEPRLDVLRDDPRFMERLKKIKPLERSKATADFVPPRTEEVQTAPKFKKRTAVAALATLLAVSLIGIGGYAAYKSRKVEKPSVVVQQNQDLPKTLVVLPFANEIDQDHALGNGLAHILTSKLGGLKQLGVRSSGVEFANKTPQEVGQVLNADFILRGTIQAEAENRCITAELVSTRSGEVFWKDKFVAPNSQFIGLQSRVAERVAEALMVALSPQERARLTRRDTESGEAYALYLAGRHKLASRSKPGMEEAIKLFNLAAERDPNFALAYSGLADAHILIVRFNKIPAQTAYQKAEEYAVKALALDPDLAEARVSLAMSRYRRTRDTAEAERNFRRAIELNPSLAIAHHWYSLVLNESDRYEEALREIKIAAELDPRSAVIHFAVGTIYQKLKQYNDAIVYYDKAIEIDNGFVSAYFSKSIMQQSQGNYDEALETYRKARIFGGKDERDPIWLMMQAQAHAAKGRKKEAFEILNNFVQTSEYRKAPANYAFDFALVHHLLGDNDQAFSYLEKLKLKDKKEVDFVTTDPRFDKLHSDSRFAELAERWRAKI